MNGSAHSVADYLCPSIGDSIPRVEDLALLTGQGKFTSDVETDHVLHMSFVRSMYAHAKVRSIDKQNALDVCGVAAVLTGAEVANEFPITVPLIGEMGASYTDKQVPERQLLAVGEVRFVGDPIALVLAETPYLAIDSCEAVLVEYDPLPVVVDPEEASKATEPRVHESLRDNIAFRWNLDSGDVDYALNRAEIVLEHRLVNQRVIPVALEPRAVLAEFDPETDQLSVWITSQIPHQYQSLIADSMGMPCERVRVIAPEVGGGFGSKLNFYVEDLLACLLSRKFARPVRWVASRYEDIQATTHGRDQICSVRLAADREGKILGLDARLIADCGAYCSSWAPFIPSTTARMMTGAYGIRHCRVHVAGVYTNKAPVEPYRGAGQPEAIYFVERSIDMLARKIGLDPADVRRRNLIPSELFPYESAGGFTYDTGDYLQAFDRALDVIGYSQIREKQAQEQQPEEGLWGVGLSSYVALGGPGPWEYGQVTVLSDGTAIVCCGTSPQGQGHKTMWAQIVADLLQVPPRRIKVLCGDTAEVPSGIGTYGSRSASVGGSAVYENAVLVRQNAVRIASLLLDAEEENVVLENGLFSVRGSPSRHVTWPQIAIFADSPSAPDGLKQSLTSDKLFKPKGFTAAFGTHACVVRIDIETGQTTIIRYVSVDDCGRVINPAIVNGQIHGGIAQGIGQALWEHARYDEAGNLLTGSLMDYAIPGAQDLPSFETCRTETPSPMNPLGVKGVGEAAAIGSTPALANAVLDALKGYGIIHLDLPLTPEKIWKAINGSSPK